MELIPEKDVEVVAENILTKIRDRIKSQIADAFYTEYSSYLYEHYVNHKDKINEKLISEIEDNFIEDPKSYKYSGLRKRLYEENKTAINKTITEDIITEGIKNILFHFTNHDFPYNWQWKDKIVRFVIDNWDKFKNDERIKSGFGNALEQKQAKIEALENQIREIELTLGREGE